MATATKAPPGATLTRADQPVFPAAPAHVPEVHPSTVKMIEYLEAAGWTQVSANGRGDTFWADPAGEGDRASKPEVASHLPGKDGSDPVPVTQHVCPPVPWTYGLHDAVTVQRARDRATKAK